MQSLNKKQQTGTMQRNNVFLSSLCLVAALVLLLTLAPSSQAMSLVDAIDQTSGKSSVTLAVVENPELVTRVLESLLRSIIYSASVDMQAQSAQKRGLDLGISRGYSGSQAGKHLMGLSAASFANGPGRR